LASIRAYDMSRRHESASALASENLSWYNRDAASHADFGS
jgi:hypothetical protein